MKKWTYAKAGVNIAQVRKTQAEIGRLVEETFRLRAGRFGEVITGFGHYASLIDIGGGQALALHVDGCGTKVLIAQLLGRYDTIGIDCVAMCVNDLICVGAEPLALVDYLAVERLDGEVVRSIIGSLTVGAEEAGVAVVGGETAVMPDVIHGVGDGRGFDLAALGVGVVDKRKIITGEAIKPGDIIVGLESSGVHSNGLTLARRVLLDEASLKLEEKPRGLGGKTLGEELLTPTKIYVKPILEITQAAIVHGLAHITGGGFTKLERFWDYTKSGFHFYNMPKPHPIFSLIQRLGRIPLKEMYRTFNMGVGFVVIAPRRELTKIYSVCRRHRVKARLIGRVIEEKKILISTRDGEISFQ
ncbi:MAG: phosphoribosylformylglycinamidine cyclo-ligase [Candidatus Bathyarchaeia archaeon]